MTGFGLFGTDEYGSDPYGSILDHLEVLSASALSPYTVVVRFGAALSPSSPAVTNPASYIFEPLSGSTTPTPVSALVATPYSVRITTTEMAYGRYRVLVDGALVDVDGNSLDPAHNSATFVAPARGTPFRAVAVGPRRVRLVFTLDLQQDDGLTDPSNYTISDFSGNAIRVSAVTFEPSQSAVTLTLADDLYSTRWYVADVGAGVSGQGGLPILPSKAGFQYVRTARTATFPVRGFTGEVRGGLYGNPAGLLFFSPALTTSAANSTISVDRVSACTQAYDTYRPPPPRPPTPPGIFLGGGPAGSGVLWAPWAKLGETRLDLELGSTATPFSTDTVPEASDGPCTLTLQERWDPSRVSLLNNPAWRTYDQTATVTPPMFICASNLTPITGSPATITYLSVPLRGDASLQANGVANWSVSGGMSGTARLQGTPA